MSEAYPERETWYLGVECNNETDNLFALNSIIKGWDICTVASIPQCLPEVAEAKDSVD